MAAESQKQVSNAVQAAVMKVQDDLHTKFVLAKTNHDEHKPRFQDWGSPLVKTLQHLDLAATPVTASARKTSASAGNSQP